MGDVINKERDILEEQCFDDDYDPRFEKVELALPIDQDEFRAAK